MTQRHKHADVIIAWANGAQIQIRRDSQESWSDVPTAGTGPSVVSWFEYYEYRMDMSTAKYFGEKDFMEALEYIGIFEA